MKRFIKSQLEKRVPMLLNGIRTLRHRRYFRKKFSAFQKSLRNQLFPNGTTIVVQAGPFQGMNYFNEVVWGCISSKWLGSYEAELHPVINQIFQKPYNTVIDVGCAEGYYAVGLALALPNAHVTAFDTDFISRRQLARLAALNHVTDRIEIRTLCHHEDINSLALQKTLVVCDIEGFETELLDPTKSTGLLHSDILVEVHENSPTSRITENLLCDRFRTSHQIDRIPFSDRTSWISANSPALHKSVPPEILIKAADENRGAGFVWLWMESRSN